MKSETSNDLSSMNHTMEEQRPAKIISYRDLEIWQLGKKIALSVYGLTDKFPTTETYGLSSQMRRCAVSIACNIAEGFNRYHNKEYRQFLYIALGSCAELETQIEISFELKHTAKEQYEQITEQLNYETRMIRNLIKKL